MTLHFKQPATRWNQLNDWQLSKLARILFSKNQRTKEQLQMEVLFVLFIRKPSFFSKIKVLFLIFLIDWQTLKTYTDFIFEDYDLDLFKAYIVKGKTLTGPPDRLSSMTMEEFITVDKLYYDYATADDKNKPIRLRRLVAALYRKVDHTSEKTDRREPFIVEKLEENARLTDQISQHEKMLIALAYKNSRQKLIKRFPLIFPKKKKTKVQTSGYHSFKNLVDTLAFHESQPLGNIHELMKTDINTFFDAYSSCIRRFKEQEKHRKLNEK